MKKTTAALMMMIILFSFVSCQGKRTYTTDTDQYAMPVDGEEIVHLFTSEGDVYIRLFPNDAPLAVDNFLTLVKTGKYDGVKFHRSLVNYLVQSGDWMNNNGTGAKDAKGGTFDTEISNRLHNTRGAVGMARHTTYNSNGSQFYIVTRAYVSVAYTEKLKQTDPELAELYETMGGEPEFDGEYTVFGQIVAGMEVVDAINAFETDDKDAPVTDVFILKAEVVKYSSGMLEQEE